MAFAGQPDSSAPPPTPVDLQLSWHALRASVPAPSERRGHSAANLDNQWIMVYGGSTSTGPSAELWALKIDLESPGWVRVDDAVGERPPALTGHSATIVFYQLPEVRAEMILFGGKGEGGETSAVYSLDVVNKRWKKQQVSGQVPAARYGHTATQLGRQLVMLCGRAGQSQFFNDVYVLDADTMQWSLKACTGTAPSPRYAHTAVCGANGTKIYVFGGSNGNETFNDLYVLDTEKWHWSEQYVTGVIPDSRAYHCAALVSSRYMMIHGGSNGANCFSDIGVLDFGSHRWSRVPVAGGRYNVFQHTSTLSSNKLFVFGGHTGSVVTSDLRVLNIAAPGLMMQQITRQLAPSTGGVDGIIAKMRALVGQPPAQRCVLPEGEIIALCDAAKAAFMSEGSLAEYGVPAQLFGDIHGQFYDLLKLFENFGYPDGVKNFVFLGDYVDRGKQSIETLTLLFAYKVKYPKHVCLIRGNHEDERINCLHGFLDECLHIYSYNAWKAFNDAFNCMPVAAVVGNRIFCVHGGLSPKLANISQVRDLHKPTSVPGDTLLEDLLWSDPAEDSDQLGFVKRSRGLKRGCSYDFGPDEVDKFLVRNRLDMIVRAHEVVQDGFEMYADGRLVTLFSAPNYCGEYDNSGAIMCIDSDFVIDFKVLQPASDPHVLAEREHAPPGLGRQDSFLGINFDPSNPAGLPALPPTTASDDDTSAAYPPVRRAISPPRGSGRQPSRF